MDTSGGERIRKDETGGGSPQLEGLNSVEAWAESYVRAETLAAKLLPELPPTIWASPREPLRIGAPGRAPSLGIKEKTRRTLTRRELQQPHKRVELLHTFLHHELQAAELMCWALLAFPETPLEFREGLLRLAQDEIRHMQLYASYLEKAGCCYGDHAVRDWFWQRAGSCETPLQFVALMNLGFEGGNLDHAKRYEEWFREMGDEEAARIQQVICEEEVEHVRFGIHWFRTWTGGLDFECWRKELVAPLSPAMLQGKTLNREARLAGGFDTDFLRELAGWRNDSPGS